MCIFYLTLRALDTVEDDMSIPISEKISMLKTFYVHLEDTNWSYMNSKETDKIVLEDFKAVCLNQSIFFLNLDGTFKFCFISLIKAQKACNCKQEIFVFIILLC